MATDRDDIRVNYAVSPRIVLVDAPSADVKIPDLHKTLRNIEAEPQNSEDGILIQSSGGESLGTGKMVAMTSELQNAKLAFASRTESKCSGSATTGNPSGTKLIDSAAQFITDGVEPGATIINLTDWSVATVISADSENQITCMPLDDGSTNQWTIGDEYKIWNTVQCRAIDGNVLAVDDNGDPMSEIFPTAFTQIIVERSSSGALLANSLSEQEKKEIAEEVWKKTVGAPAADTFGGYVKDTKVSTGPLPADPASGSAVTGAIAASQGAIQGDVANVQDTVDGIRVDDVPLLRGDIDGVPEKTWKEPVVDPAVGTFGGRVEKTYQGVHGGWRLVANQMIFYDSNGVEINRFDLFDEDGNPTMANVFRRVPV